MTRCRVEYCAFEIDANRVLKSANETRRPKEVGNGLLKGGGGATKGGEGRGSEGWFGRQIVVGSEREAGHEWSEAQGGHALGCILPRLPTRTAVIDKRAKRGKRCKNGLVAKESQFRGGGGGQNS